MTNRSETPASSSNPCSPSPPKFPNHSICFSPALGSNWSSDSCACAKSEKLTDRHIVRASVKCFIGGRSEEHTSELQSLMRTSYAVFCLKKKTHLTSAPRLFSFRLHQLTPQQPTLLT